MADAQELMLRVRGDNSGVDKAMAGTTKTIEKLKISGQKAGQAFRSFSSSLSQAKNASDVAASAAESLGHIVGKSLVGAVAVGGVKVFTDQITRMGEMLRDTATVSQKSFNDIEKAGGSINLSEAISQVSSIDSNIESLNNKIDELERNSFQKFISGATGARTELEALLKTNEKLRDLKLAEGIINQNVYEELTSGLDAEGKALRDVNDEYEKRNKLAESIKDPKARKEFQDASGEVMARKRNAILDKIAKDRAESDIKFRKMVFDAEEKLEKSSDERRRKSEQEITERRISNINSVLREEMYNIDETSRLEENKEKTKFDRLLRDLYRGRAEERKKPEQAQQAGGGLLGASRSGQQALDVARKVRARENKTADFKTQEKVFDGMQEEENKKRAKQGLPPISRMGIMEREAAKQAAGEAPSLSEKLLAGQTGQNPAQIAAEQAKGGGGKDSQTLLLKAIEELNKKLPAAVAQ
jgi:hypothetical protein